MAEERAETRKTEPAWGARELAADPHERSDKAERVHKFHRNTVHALAEMIAAMGLDHTDQLTYDHVIRRVSQYEVRTFGEIHQPFPPGSLLEGGSLVPMLVVGAEEPPPTELAGVAPFVLRHFGIEVPAYARAA